MRRSTALLSLTTMRTKRSGDGRGFRLLLLIGLMSLGVRVTAQESLSSEAILALIEDDETRQRAAEELERLELHPLDLNTATADDLACVPLLDPFFIPVSYTHLTLPTKRIV